MEHPAPTARASRRSTRPAAAPLWLLALLLVVVACGSESQARRRLADAREQVEQGEIEGAVRSYEQLIDRFPDTDAARTAREELTLYRGLTVAVDSYPQRMVRDKIVATARALYRFRSRNGKWPGALDGLSPRYLPESPIDPWGRPFLYTTKRRGYVLGCLGSDGATGGEGDARDWYIEDGRFVSRPSVALP